MDHEQDRLRTGSSAARLRCIAHLGPGLLESAYQTALCAGACLQRTSDSTAQRACPLRVSRRRRSASTAPDLIVENTVVVEIKSVLRLEPVFTAQLLTYLRITGLARWPAAELQPERVERRDKARRAVKAPTKHQRRCLRVLRVSVVNVRGQRKISDHEIHSLACGGRRPGVDGPGIRAAGDRPSIPALYSGMRWRSVGPARGGRSIAAGGSDARPLEYWFGATGGGAWKTTDGGSNWAPMTDGKITTSSIGSLAVCQSNPDVVYIGGGETQFRGNIIQGDGVYKTTDGGVKWDHLADLRDSQAIARLRVHPDQLRHRLRGGARPGLQRPSAARHLQVRPTAARPGDARCSATRRPAASTCRSIRRTRT